MTLLFELFCSRNCEFATLLLGQVIHSGNSTAPLKFHPILVRNSTISDREFRNSSKRWKFFWLAFSPCKYQDATSRMVRNKIARATLRDTVPHPWVWPPNQRSTKQNDKSFCFVDLWFGGHTQGCGTVSLKAPLAILSVPFLRPCPGIYMLKMPTRKLSIFWNSF